MNFLEGVGFVTGIAGVWLTMRKNIWCFPVGLLNVTISLFLFYHQQLYADALQQLVYIVLLAYGWMHWFKTSGRDKEDGRISSLSGSGLLFSLLVISASTLILGYVLNTFTKASFPWIDSFATSMAFLAQFLVARRKIENWMLWMMVNAIYIVIYYQKGLMLYMVLFTAYGILSVMGWRNWRRTMVQQNLKLQTQEA